MKRVVKSLLVRSTVVGVLASITVLPLLTQSAIAQTSSSSDLLENPQSGDGNSSDPFSGNGSEQGNSMLDLIHRAMLGATRSQQEFLQDQQDSLDTEAADFRARQQQRLQQQNQPTVPTPASPEAN